MSSLTGFLFIRHNNNHQGRAIVRRLSTLTAAPPPAIVPPKGVPAFVSRRQWNKLYQAPPRQAPKKDNLDDKPWPRSVQMLGYAVGTTVVPYCIAWFVASNVTLREWLDPIFPDLLPTLRPWFGHEEVDAVSYVDRRQEGDQLVVPRALDNEDSTKVRKEQAAVTLLNQETAIPTRIRVFTNSGFNLGEILQLPGATRMTKEELLNIMMKDRSMSLDVGDVSHITVEFTDLKDDDETTTTTDEDIMVTVHVPESSTNTLRQDIARMLKTTSIFSAWHLFPQAVQQYQQQDQQPTNATTQTSSSQDEMRMAQLEYEIEQLDKLLKDHTTMRSFDDIQQEMNAAKSELRKLKWKNRLRWFGASEVDLDDYGGVQFLIDHDIGHSDDKREFTFGSHAETDHKAMTEMRHLEATGPQLEIRDHKTNTNFSQECKSEEGSLHQDFGNTS
ncbi:expressed unknown protein [Seminavis robusta]|uniref:Uncharacterized protein n=1 Tax=Seminavis robusta TaxID=568900 RepID=A0A9N8ELF9_9STRA|nr:expressed unknown protein [Seminavis robusta]|eukprot:Sro1162_g247940.1 n/a (444) ;mRNA; r:31260-32712